MAVEEFAHHSDTGRTRLRHLVPCGEAQELMAVAVAVGSIVRALVGTEQGRGEAAEEERKV